MQHFADNHDLIMAHVPALDDIPESTEDQSPDETCTCTCGGAESEDHTPGNGCERRGCICFYWPEEN